MLTLAFNSKHHCAVDSCVVFNVGTGLLLEYFSNELKSTTATALIIGASDKQGVRVWLCRFFSGIFLYGIILLWTGSAELLSPPCGSDSNYTKTVDMFMSNLKTLNAKNRQVSQGLNILSSGLKNSPLCPTNTGKQNQLQLNQYSL